MKSKKAQGILVGIMMFVVAFIVIVQFIGPIKDQITTARNPSSLDCTNTSITTGDKSTCVVVDITLFYFVGMAIGAAAIFLGGKFIRDRITR